MTAEELEKMTEKEIIDRNAPKCVVCGKPITGPVDALLLKRVNKDQLHIGLSGEEKTVV